MREQLALGPAPCKPSHLRLLDAEGIRAILSLCAAEEHPQPPSLTERFKFARVPLPDHRCGHPPTALQLQHALETLHELSGHGSVYVHCLASMERSPLLCLAWLMRERGLSRLQALDYLSHIHPGTNPLPEQLALLNSPFLLQP